MSSNAKLLVVFSTLLVAIIVDMIAPIEIYTDFVYLVVFLVFAMFRLYSGVLLITILTTFSQVLVLIYKHLDVAVDQIDVTNRLISIFETWIFAFVLLWFLKAKASEAQIQKIVEDSQQAIFCTDHEGNITYWNNGAEKVFNLKKSEVLKKSASILFPANSLSEFQIPLMKVQKNKNDQEIETIGARSTGEKFEVSLLMSPLIEGSRVVGSTVIARDISEQVKLQRSIVRERSQAISLLQDISTNERKLQNANESLKEKTEEMEQFVNTVSHDLKSPMVTIEGLIGLLEQDIKDEDWQEVEESLRGMRSSVKKMSCLVQDLLELSRIGRIPFQVETLDLDGIFNEVIEGHKVEIMEKGIHIKFRPTNATLTTDSMRLYQIIDNLVTNAIKYGSGNKDPVIDIEYRQLNSGWCEIVISDNGAGIDPAYQEKVFRIFEQLSAGSSGSGVGLAIVQRITKILGGNVRLNSELNRGARFTVMLPLKLSPGGQQIYEAS